MIRIAFARFGAWEGEYNSITTPHTGASCTADADCYDDDPATSDVCFPGCVDSDDCETGEICDIPAGTLLGACV